MEAMKRQPQVWEILVSVLPVFIGITIWLYNVGTTVEKHEVRIQNVEKSQSDYKEDMKQINIKLEQIIIKLEDKQNREEN